MEQVVDHLVSSFVVELGSHVTNTLEGHELKLIGQGPDFSTVLSAVCGCGIPSSPILFGGKLEFFSDLVDPSDGSGIGNSGISIT